jgi:tetraacyldisaccharide 4'-kinase
VSFRDTLINSWSKPNLLTLLLWPVSQIYRSLYWLRTKLYNIDFFKRYKASVPVIVVGNLTVGGTGKTPLVIYLVERLRAAGYTPGVISRGYGSAAPLFPFHVGLETSVAEAGDEPFLIVNRTAAPLVIGPNRGESIDALLAKHAVDVIISDDGLQHLALQRDIELCLLDKTSPQNNRNLLPAGPYRESLSRLSSVDFVINHGGSEGEHIMHLVAGEPASLLPDKGPLLFDAKEPIHAMAGIGNPQRFFDTCDSLDYQFTAHAFPDHHDFTADDINFGDSLNVLMTEKDAVKCKNFALRKHWYLPVNAKLSGNLIEQLLEILTSLSK